MSPGLGASASVVSLPCLVQYLGNAKNKSEINVDYTAPRRLRFHVGDSFTKSTLRCISIIQGGGHPHPHYGPPSGAPTSSLGGFMGSAGGNSEQGAALRYMQQLMQSKSVGGGNDLNKSLLGGGSPFSAPAPQSSSLDAPIDRMY